MGIKNLHKFIINNNLEKDDIFLENHKVAIDISILLYKVVISTRCFSGTDHLDRYGDISTHILGLFNKTIYLLQREIIPIFIFDGKPPEIKYKALNTRRETKKKALKKLEESTKLEDKKKYLKRSVTITKKQYNDCRELLNILGIPYIDAPQEADSQCSYLAKKSIVNGVVTDDMDILTFGSPLIIKNIYSYSKKTKYIKLEDLLSKIRLNYDEFIDWCCLLGSDYCKGVKDLDPLEILDVYKSFRNLEETVKHFKLNNYSLDTLEQYQKTKNYFLHPKIINFDNKIDFKYVDIKKLDDFLVNRFGFDRKKLFNKYKFLVIRNKKLFIKKINTII